MQIRLLDREDEAEMLALVRMNVDEFLPHLGYDDEVARATFNRAVSGPQPTVFVAEDTDGHLVGFFYALAIDYAFCAGFFTTQEVLYVRPDKRGTRAAALLVRRFNEWSDRLGPREVHVGIANGFQAERTTRFFEHFGFKRVGTYLRRIIG